MFTNFNSNLVFPKIKMGNKNKPLESNLVIVAAVSVFCAIINPISATITVVSEITNVTLSTIDDQPARFIPERFSFYGIQGYVMHANPPSACGIVDPPPILPYPHSIDFPVNWILLARRSPECHFQDKIENAQNAGYNAVIIHNVGSNSTEIMGVDDPTKIIIYATFVGEYDGEVLKNCSYIKGCFIRIQDDFSINGYLLPFAIVVGMCFIVMIFFMVRLLYQQVIRWLRERRRSRRRKLPASALKKLPTQKWTKGDPYETCAVCLDDFVEQDKIRVLPCSHGFHMKCIDPWLTKGRRVCPICKRKVIVADERFRDSDSDTDDETAPLLGTSASANQTANGEETFVQGENSEGAGHSQSHVDGGGRFARRSRPRPSIDSDASSMTSVCSHGGSGSGSSAGGAGAAASSSQAHQSRSVLAEVHHSSEVLRQKIDEMEQQHNLNLALHDHERLNELHSVSGQGQLPQSQSCGEFHSQDNAVYIPDVEFEDAEANAITSRSYHEDTFSSRLPIESVSVAIHTSSGDSDSETHANDEVAISSSSNPNPNPIV